MVAAHADDLAAARAAGLRTAYVPRPLEHGPGRAAPDADGAGWNYSAEDLGALAAVMFAASA
jgi:2-haloacid dehalogenase